MDNTGYLDFQNRLKDFPHSFQLQNYDRLRRERFEIILKRLQSEQKSTKYASKMEEIRDHNFISFLYFNLKQYESAFAENALARRKDTTNIVAMANYVHMLYLQGHVEETDSILLSLDQMKTEEQFHFKLVLAKAELAYSYNRLGPIFGENSVNCYEEVLKVTDYPEKSHIFVWEFGAALAVRRHYMRNKAENQATKVSGYLEDIILGATNKVLVAKSWVEKAETHRVIKRDPSYVQQMKYYLQKALEKCDNDAFILERCGKYYRYVGDLHEAKRLLKMAINIRPTTFSYEHLALAFQEHAKQAQKKHSTQRIPYPIDSGPWSFSNCHPQSLDSGFGSNVHAVPPVQIESSTIALFEQENQRSATACLSLSEVTHASAFDQDAPYSVSESEETSRYELQTHTPLEQSKLNPNAAPFYPRDHQTTYMQTQKEQLDMTQVHRNRSLIETTPTDLQSARQFESTSFAKQFRQAVFKSPQTCLSLPKNDPRVKDAVYYFQKSLEISDGLNQTAVYELGLLYRHIRSYDKSIEYCRKILKLKSSGHYIDQQMLINAYEQIGLCYRDKAEETEEETEKLKLRESGRKMLTKAIEECARQVAGKCKAVASLPTLRAILTDDFQTTGNTENLKELGRLNKLVGRYKDSLTFYHMLFEQDLTTAKNPEIAVSVIENFLKVKDYQNAAVFLDILMCTEEGKTMAKESDLIHRLHAESALYYMKKRDYLSSQGCFQSAFLYHYNCLAVDKDDMWDVVVLDDPDVASKEADCLKQQLQDVCGLQVTRNMDDALGGLLELHAQTGIIEKSKMVLILIGNNEMSKSFVISATLVVEMMTRGGKPSSVVVVALDTGNVPSYFGTLPCKKYVDMEGGVNGEEGRGWLLDLFQKLIGVK